MRDPKKTNDRSRQLRTIRSQVLRSGRRQALAATLLLMSSPLVMGDEPQQTELRILPPLPVQQVANHEVYGNPFCEPELRPIKQGDVKLASSQAQTAIRLKSAGTAIDLQPIGTGQPIQVRPRTMKIETPSTTSGIQHNPLLQSKHHLNRNLVDVSLPRKNAAGESAPSEFGRLPQPITNAAPLTLPEPIASEAGPVTQSATNPDNEWIMPVTQPVGDAKPVISAPVVSTPVQRSILMRPPATSVVNESPVVVPAKPMTTDSQDDAVKRAVVSSPVANPVTEMQPESTAEKSEPVAQRLVVPPVAVALTEKAKLAKLPAPETPKSAPAATTPKSMPAPVYFSMSDDSSQVAKPPQATAAESAMDEQDIQSPSDLVANSASENAIDQTVEPVVIPKLDERLGGPVVALAEPVGLKPLDESKLDGPNDFADTATELPRPIRGRIPASVASTRSAPQTAALSSMKRYHAPVAVDAPPVAMTQRRPDQGTPAIAVSANPINLQKRIKSATTQSPSLPAKPARAANEPTKLHLTKAQVRSLTIGGMVRRVDVSNKNVCQAITSGPNQLKLIGTGNGVARLVVWADTSGNSRTRARAFEIHVQDAVEATGGSVGNKTETLNRSIFDAFPTANVSVQELRDRLVVSGVCDSEDDAKKIIRMVRKTCLIPVRDEIKVR